MLLPVLIYFPRFVHAREIVDGRRNSVAVMAIGIACNLHQLSDPNKHDWGILTPPTDDLHVAERINLWWSLYLLERLIAMVTATPGMCSLYHFRVRAELSLR